MTAREFAETIQKPYTTVMGWLQNQLVPGARLVESPIGSYYEIPVGTVQSFSPPKRGRPKKNDEAEAVRAPHESATAKTKTTTKKRVSKKTGN